MVARAALLYASAPAATCQSDHNQRYLRFIRVVHRDGPNACEANVLGDLDAEPAGGVVAWQVWRRRRWWAEEGWPWLEL